MSGGFDDKLSGSVTANIVEVVERVRVDTRLMRRLFHSMHLTPMKH